MKFFTVKCLPSLIITSLLLCIIFLATTSCSKSQLLGTSGDIWILGDSLSTETGVSPPIWSDIVGERTARNIVNLSIDGATISDGLRTLRETLKATNRKPTLLIIFLGANDTLKQVPVEQSEGYLKEIVNTAMAENINVLICDAQIPIPFSRQINFKGLARQFDVLYVGGLIKTLRSNSKFLQLDGVHPNEAGHAAMAELISATIK